MLLSEGDKILVAHRRLYAEDPPRFFVGQVMGYDAGIVKVTGHTWVREPMRGVVLEKPGQRTKIFSIASGTLLVYELPFNCVFEKLKIRTDENGEAWLTDGQDLHLNLAEREPPPRGAGS